jgi:phosphoesterase RecJ-like protein
MLDALVGAGRVLLTGPVRPDGDSIGACLALQRVLERHGVVCAVTGQPSYRYTWMPRASEMLPDADVTPDWPAVVVLDGDRHRLTPGAEAAFAAAEIRAIIDHHRSTENDGYTHFWVDPDVGSACEMLYAALPEWDVPLDRALAEVLYTGLVFDTGAFRYSNTTPASHAMAAALLDQGIDHATICLNVLMDRRIAGLRLAGEVFGSATLRLDQQMLVAAVTVEQCERLGASAGDLEGLVENLVHVQGVEVGVLLIEYPEDRVKLSLRSRGRVDVASVARELAPSGGGHAKAAGVVVSGPCRTVIERTTQVVGAHLRA